MICVDYLQACNPNQWWRWDQVSHLHCLPTDDIEELHLFAEKIGLQRERFQAHSIIPHYDLMPATREAAVRAGATELLTRWELVANIRLWRVHRYGPSGNRRPR
jgi:hypothetical protein